MNSIEELLGVRAVALADHGGHQRLQQPATVEWYTPPSVFEALGLTFDLDPCSPPGGLPWIPAKRQYSLPEDGLALPWEGRIWCNPPYGREAQHWVAKMNGHRNGVALVFARTDVEWFHDSAVEAEAILFLKGRVQFVDATGKPPLLWDKRKQRMRRAGNAGAPSMLLAWSEECSAALRRIANAGGGLFVQPSAPSSEKLGDLL